MADEKLDMSLDQIIASKQTKQAKTSRAPRESGPANQRVRGRNARSNVPDLSRTRPAPAGRGRGRSFRGADDRTRFVVAPERSMPATNGRGMMKRQGRPIGVADPVRAQAIRDAALNGPGKWKHDLFVDDGAPRRNRVAPAAQGTKLIVSNLDYKVDDNDIKELFSLEGELLSWGVTYDESGRSEGVAEVVFKERAHALSALKRYHGVSLDNKQMSIKLVASGNNVLHTLSSGISVTRAAAPEAGPRTGLQLPRTFQQSMHQAAQQGGRGIGSGARGRRTGGAGRLRSSVVADEEYMDTN